MQVKKLTKLILLICIIGTILPVALAQEAGDGQVCVRAFEDRNGNATFDPNEPPITQGIGVNLLNIQSVTIASALLEDSEDAALGTVCFRQLLAGDYTVIVTSADYTATTPTTFNALVIPQSVPTRLDFGGQIITTNTTDGTPASATLTEDQQDRALQGILFGAIGAVMVVFIMVIAGMFIYFAVFRRRMNRIMAMQSTGGFRPVTGPMPAYQPGTGPMQAVRPDTSGYPPVNPGTGAMPPVNPDTDSMPPAQSNNPLLTRDPNEGSPPLFNEEDTDQMGSI